MATPNVLTQNNLDYARSLLDQGRVSGMYDYLAAQGYQYARLANGVARGDSPAGLIALEFMENTAQAQGHTLSEAEVNSIRGDMANGYLRALQQQLDNSTTDTVSRDITADEAWSFHSDVFQNHHLSADAWTLNTPFEIIVDSAARQAYWQQVLNAAGDPVAEASLSVGTYVSMSINTAITSPENADKARSWLLRLDNLETYADVVGALGLQFDKVASTFGDRVFDATNSPSIAALAKASASIVGSLFYGWSFAL
ncbi:MAG: hypothetical protein IPJ99_18860 [Betaproteobacteria bacterium]|nr:hypothetical protein [Betaproteobacteria bacterium]MBK8918194.1 hypothetical protein [Betaproteobacteria bacterium]